MTAFPVSFSVVSAKPRTFLNRAITGILLQCILVGCGDGKTESQRQGELKQLGFAYHSFLEEHQRGPTGPTELTFLSPEMAKELESGELVIVWDVRLEDQKSDPSTLVLAYRKTPLSSGNRQVLMANGAVETMTEADFAKAPKAEATRK